MSNAEPAATTLEYATPATKARLTVQVTDDGITIYDRPAGTWPAVGITALMLVALGLPLLVVSEIHFDSQFVGSNQFRLLVLLIVLVIVAMLFLRAVWKRRGVRMLIRVQGERLIIVTPDRFHLSREWPVSEVRWIGVVTMPLTFGRSRTLQVRTARRRRIALFEGCCAAELDHAKRELLTYLPHLGLIPPRLNVAPATEGGEC